MFKNTSEALAATGTMFKSQIASRVDVALEQDAQDASDERRWNREIDARDGRCCRACGKRTNPDDLGLLRGHRAHIVYASAGGSMEPSNRVTLCPSCHEAEHDDDLRFTAEGGPYVGIDANGPMEFWRKDEHERFYLSRCESAPGVVIRD
jgi:hypothetical protein